MEWSGSCNHWSSFLKLAITQNWTLLIIGLVTALIFGLSASS
jgi:hypothetical protein